ncbi:MAG: alpha-2-macroglobulin family protein, partial [Desulfovibrio sp.]|nr:alpha-2-macroglobulin family protein [Desulfovibrio sp.]
MSPAEKLIGFRPAGETANLDFAPAGREAKVELIAIDDKLSKTAWDDLEFAISRKEYATNLVSDSMGGYKYDETPVNSPFKSWRDDIPAKGKTLTLPANVPGDYVLTVKSAGKTVCEIPYSVVGDRIRAPEQSQDPAKARIKVDKSEYKAGETARIALSLPYDGAGLITLERDKVEAFALFSARAGDSVQSLKIPDNFEGKGYIVVHFVRSAESPAVYAEPRAVAVAPVMIDAKKRNMGLALTAPESVEPGGILNIGLKSANKGKAIVFAVDEGIHSLTNYKAPDPIAELLGNRALTAETIQGYDLLMPANLRGRTSMFGGGMDAPFNGKFRNPFKRKDEPPLVFWSGPVDAGPDGIELEIPVPAYYNGSLRVCAVGVAADRAGAANASVKIAAPLILTPAVPLAVSPGDRFEGALVIENTTPREQRVKLEFDFEPGLLIDNYPEKEVAIEQNSEIRLPFLARAPEIPGAITLKFKAISDGREYARESSMSIRPVSYLKTAYKAGRADKTREITTDRDVFPDDARIRVSVSPLPLPMASALGQYLEAYPHGCTEQLISRAFALLSLRDWRGADKNLEKQLSAAITAIGSRLKSGGVALWPDSEPDLALTVYAADFLLAARAAGYGNDLDTLERLRDILKEQCVLNDSSLESARTVAYGVWVLTRAGLITTQLIENL